jgi:hypothetical protein
MGAYCGNKFGLASLRLKTQAQCSISKEATYMLPSRFSKMCKYEHPESARALICPAFVLSMRLLRAIYFAPSAVDLDPYLRYIQICKPA